MQTSPVDAVRRRGRRAFVVAISLAWLLTWTLIGDGPRPSSAAPPGFQAFVVPEVGVPPGSKAGPGDVSVFSVRVQASPLVNIAAGGTDMLHVDFGAHGEFRLSVGAPEDIGLGGLRWPATLVDEPEAWVGIVASADVPTSPAPVPFLQRLVIAIQSPRRGDFEVEPDRLTPGLHVAREKAYSRLPPCGTVPQGKPPETVMALPPPRVERVPIDVNLLVCYTDEAVAITPGLRSLIQLAVVSANDGLNESDVGATMQYRLVAMVQVTDEGHESGELDVILAAAERQRDGRLDRLHALRNDYAADLVSLVVDASLSQLCGYGSLPFQLTPARPDLAFSVVRRACFGNHTLAHELGHNFGCCHQGDCSSPPYRHPHQVTLNRQPWGTLMMRGAARRLRQFSNPTVSIQGVATGVANVADNARLVREMARTVAGYK